MAILNRATSGLMLEEKRFDHNLLWDLSPNDYSRIACNSDSVELDHGEQRISMSIQSPGSSYVFQTEVEHEPTTLSDVGGVVINSVTDNAIECQTFYSYSGGSSQYIKFIKVCVDKEVYTFYGSVDGVTWQDLGNSKLIDANRIGFFLDGTKTVNSKRFTVKNVFIYKSNVVTFNNIPTGSKIKIIDTASNNVIGGKETAIKQYNNKLYVDFTNMLLPLENVAIQIFDSSDKVIVNMKDVTIYGGDIYEYSDNIRFTLDGIDVDPRNSVDLGRLTSKETTHELTIKNLDDNVLIGKTLRIEAYSDYYRGFTNVKLAVIPDMIGSTPQALTYTESVTLPEIPKDKIIRVKMLLTKDRHNLGPFLADKYRFRIVFD